MAPPVRTAPTLRARAIAGRAWPWVAGLAILALVISRVPFAAFRAALSDGPHLAVAAVDVGMAVAVLCTDSVATWFGLAALRMRRPLRRIAAVRGATFLLFLINYAVAQGGFGYYLHRTGEKPLRAGGAVLFLMGTNFATLLVLTSVAGLASGGPPPQAAMQWTLAIACAGLFAYLVVIALAPAVLAKRAILAPLFDAGVRGHGIAMLARIPHVVVIVLGDWAAMRAWGIHVPFSAGITLVPVVVIAASLPISPAGLGTTQAAFTLLFASYATGATAELRTGQILAFALVHFVYGVACSLTIGSICLPFARRAGLRGPDPTPAASAP